MTTTPHHLSDRYQLGETLGFGGMSEVHFARDLLLNRDVAIKVLRADLARDPSFYLRFRREAQNAAKLNHPTIVQVFDTGEAQTDDGPLPFIVMEYVEGETLRDILRADGPLSERQALTWMADVAAAMDFSHRAHIVHRDMKPANVMIDRTGAVKVMDFGIARAMNDTGATMTQTSAVMGTAQYLSPEQARGLKVDPRSDIYSMGCVLFELLTGEPPFTGDSPVAVAHQHVHEDPPLPSDLRSDISPALDSVILKAISKNPENRYQTAAELRADMIRVLSGQRPSAPMIMSAAERTDLIDTGSRARVRPTPGGRHDPAAAPEADEQSVFRQRRMRALAALVAVIALVGGLLYWGFSSGSEPQHAVPKVAGQSEQDAKKSLSDAGFKVKTMQESSLEVPAGNATRSTPGSGVLTAEGSEVTLYISTGPQRQKMPDVKGKSKADAIKMLKSLGFTVIKTDKTDSPRDLIDKAVSTTPPVNADTEVNSVIVVHIGQGPKKVTIPELVGETEDQARAILKQLGVQMTVVPGDSEMPRGEVVMTSPDAGSTITDDQTVTVTVSRGNMFVVPDLVGKTPAQARAALASAGWRVSTLTQSTRSLPLGHPDNGRIVAQDPPAGSAIRKDDGVSIVVGESRLIG
ncbi:Stk1 family PASTA domain-containing Ser/Thr kinase [Gordonia sp. X0973]|uniref:Stk1 family PASTA domain-containing Ser/Thr kinase n=1 Tax=Gordonia sp. X0973 TaxID=2742602 RepID=UPI000F51EEDE|nr:Stk1 family PASTA domain-containing Ser/Thr kinase [Gordonia sp. X0973]QKT05779.1 Stk1 family PASTA domain-containing Ser/Thr kinase [Gordonia sp. X0973]